MKEGKNEQNKECVRVQLNERKDIIASEEASGQYLE
jgi:hypothetical protein